MSWFATSTTSPLKTASTACKPISTWCFRSCNRSRRCVTRASIQPQRVGARLESAVLVFGAELRAIHSLLYSPQRAPEETVLEAILVALASAIGALSDLLTCLPPDFDRSPTLQHALENIRVLADDICAECVPQVYAPGLTTWMDRIQQTARKIV